MRSSPSRCAAAAVCGRDRRAGGIDRADACAARAFRGTSRGPTGIGRLVASYCGNLAVTLRRDTTDFRRRPTGPLADREHCGASESR
jgi:hypothetical protein